MFKNFLSLISIRVMTWVYFFFTLYHPSTAWQKSSILVQDRFFFVLKSIILSSEIYPTVFRNLLHKQKLPLSDYHMLDKAITQHFTTSSVLWHWGLYTHQLTGTLVVESGLVHNKCTTTAAFFHIMGGDWCSDLCWRSLKLLVVGWSQQFWHPEKMHKC